jgi:hypothetical protein
VNQPQLEIGENLGWTISTLLSPFIHNCYGSVCFFTVVLFLSKQGNNWLKLPWLLHRGKCVESHRGLLPAADHHAHWPKLMCMLSATRQHPQISIVLANTLPDFLWTKDDDGLDEERWNRFSVLSSYILAWCTSKQGMMTVHGLVD